MRRAIAFLLLAVFSGMLIAPFFAQDSEASLPPCCRRHGRHHCMMRRIYDAQQSVNERCPCWPKNNGAVASRISKPEAGEQSAAQAVRPAVLPERRETLRRTAFFDSHPKRGPPTNLA